MKKLDYSVFTSQVKNRIEFITRPIMGYDGIRRLGWRLEDQANNIVIDSPNFDFLIRTKNMLLSKKKLTQ